MIDKLKINCGPVTKIEKINEIIDWINEQSNKDCNHHLAWRKYGKTKHCANCNIILDKRFKK